MARDLFGCRIADVMENWLLVPVSFDTGYPCLALVDSGAGSSFIAASFAKSLGLLVFPVDNLHVQGFGVDSLVGVTGVCSKQFNFHGREITSVPLYVIDSLLQRIFSKTVGYGFSVNHQDDGGSSAQAD